MARRHMLHGAAILVLLGSAAGCSREAAPARRPSPMFLSAVSPTDTAWARERDTCAPLEDARFAVQDVPGGVLVTIRPSATTDLVNVHDGARELEFALRRPDRLVEARGADDSCDLPELAAHHVEVTVVRTAEGATVRILTRDPARLTDVRRDAREFVDELD